MLCGRGVARTNVASMNEFITVSSSSYDPASLATKLTEKAAEGWNVVAIVPTGGDVTAFLSRGTEPAQTHTEPDTESTESVNADLVSMAPAAAVEAAAVEAEPVTEPATEPEAVSEPAGWASAPEETAPAPVEVAAAAAAVAPAAVAPAVPAGWYGDPAGRFELRYWDGGAWTEHVSRAGQQFTDPPVA